MILEFLFESSHIPVFISLHTQDTPYLLNTVISFLKSSVLLRWDPGPSSSKANNSYSDVTRYRHRLDSSLPWNQNKLLQFLSSKCQVTLTTPIVDASTEIFITERNSSIRGTAKHNTHTCELIGQLEGVGNYPIQNRSMDISKNGS